LHFWRRNVTFSKVYKLETTYVESAASIWFEIWRRSCIRANKISIFPDKFPRNFDFFNQFYKNFDFSRQIFKNFDFFRQIFKNFDFFRQFLKKFDFPGKNCSFTAASLQIILFIFESHHFRTYFLYRIRYNNISRPVHDPSVTPHDPLPKIWGVATFPTPRIDASGQHNGLANYSII